MLIIWILLISSLTLTSFSISGITFYYFPALIISSKAIISRNIIFNKYQFFLILFAIVSLFSTLFNLSSVLELLKLSIWLITAIAATNLRVDFSMRLLKYYFNTIYFLIIPYSLFSFFVLENRVLPLIGDPIVYCFQLYLAFYINTQFNFLSKKQTKIFNILVLFLMALSYSKIGYIFILLIFIFWVYSWLSKNSIYLNLIFLFFSGILIGSLIFYYLNSVRSLIAFSDTGYFSLKYILSQITSGRSLLWQASITSIKDAPIFGHGLGNFYKEISVLYRYSFVEDTKYAIMGIDGGAHSTFFRLISETGILGILTYFSYLGALAFKSFPYKNSTQFLLVLLLVNISADLSLSPLQLILIPTIFKAKDFLRNDLLT